MVEQDPDALCRLLGVAQRPRILSAALPSGTLAADLLLQVAEDQLVQVEYMRTGEKDLVARMLIYRGLILRTDPRCRLSQYVLVLGAGRVRGYDDYAGSGFALDLNVIYLRELDPSVFLDGPGLAPLAVLGQGSADERAKAFATAVALIREHGGAQARDLLEFANLLATITLDSSTIERIVEEADMMTLEEKSRALEEIAEEFGETPYMRSIRQRERQEGREAGREAGREELLTALLRERFGDHPQLAATAHRLAAWPDATTAIHAISVAGSLDAIPTS
jgi:predicted transposase YdaD